MQISYKTKRVELTDELRQYTEKRIRTCEKLLGAHATVALCDVELAKVLPKKRGAVFYAEANLSVRGDLFRATAQSETLEAAIDEVKNELQKELRRFKRKREAKAREGGKKIKERLRGVQHPSQRAPVGENTRDTIM